MDAGASAASAVPAVDPGLHGGSSRISPCARLIPAAEPTPGSRSRAYSVLAGVGGTRAERKHAEGGGGRGAPGGGAGKPADPDSVLRPLPSRCLPGSRTEVAGAARARKQGEGSAVGDEGETFSGPLNRPPTLVPERGRERPTDVSRPFSFQSAVHTCCQMKGERGRIPSPLEEGSRTAYPSPALLIAPPSPSLARTSAPRGALQGGHSAAAGGGRHFDMHGVGVCPRSASFCPPIPEWHRLIPMGLGPSSLGRVPWPPPRPLPQT